MKKGLKTEEGFAKIEDEFLYFIFCPFGAAICAHPDRKYIFFRRIVC